MPVFCDRRHSFPACGCRCHDARETGWGAGSLTCSSGASPHSQRSKVPQFRAAVDTEKDFAERAVGIRPVEVRRRVWWGRRRLKSLPRAFAVRTEWPRSVPTSEIPSPYLSFRRRDPDSPEPRCKEAIQPFLWPCSDSQTPNGALLRARSPYQRPGTRSSRSPRPCPTDALIS